MIVFPALSPRHRKVATEILKILDGLSISTCCDILDIINVYLSENVTDYDDLEETIFHFSEGK